MMIRETLRNRKLTPYKTKLFITIYIKVGSAQLHPVPRGTILLNTSLRKFHHRFMSFLQLVYTYSPIKLILTFYNLKYMGSTECFDKFRSF